MIKKTHRFTLIEVILATSLFGILMFSVTSLFFRYQKLSVKLDSIRPYVFERNIFYEKILEMTSALDVTSINTSSPHYSEYLSFYFDNGFKDNAGISGRVLCEIYRTFDKELIYKITGDDNKELKRPLLSGVNAFNYNLENNRLTLSVQNSDSSELVYTFNLSKAQ